MRSVKSIKRFMKKDFGPKKLNLPKSLEFLSDINFYAITEDSSSGKKIRTIEIKPTPLKRLVEDIDILCDSLNDSDEMIKKLRSDIRKLKNDNRKLDSIHVKSREIEIELENSRKEIADLTREISAASRSKLETEKLRKQLDEIKKADLDREAELLSLRNERSNLIDLIQERNDLQEEVNNLRRVNTQLMQNIAESDEKDVKRSKNAFFGSDKLFKLRNRKPYQGGQPS